MEQAPEVSSTGDRRWPWEVCLDDETAHLRSDAVDDLVTALEALPGVDEAYRQDRESILLRGQVSEAAIRGVVDRWARPDG